MLRSDASGICDLLEDAKASHTKLGAAHGSYHSGAMEHWLAEWDTDRSSASALVEQVVDLGEPGEAMSQGDLEARLNAVQDLQHQLANLAGKYKDSLAKDDEGRAQLRADHRVVMQARMEEKPCDACAEQYVYGLLRHLRLGQARRAPFGAGAAAQLG